MDADVTELGGADRAFVWFPWPFARLKASRDRATIVSVLGAATYERTNVDRVLLYKRAFGPWGIRFETRIPNGKGQIGFVPVRGRRVLDRLRALGWPTEEQPPAAP